jgi:hypothetical protein
MGNDRVLRCEINTLNYSIIAISGVSCATVDGTRTTTTFRVFLSLTIRKKDNSSETII